MMTADSSSEQPAEGGGKSAVDVSQLPKGRGYWAETWIRFRQRKIAMAALYFVVFLALVALFAPLLAGAKPIVCKYQGKIYFPCLAYYHASWEPAVFIGAPFFGYYTQNLKKLDPDSWAVWPLIVQDPYVGMNKNMAWPGQPPNPTNEAGKPYLYYLALRAYDSLAGTDRANEVFGGEPQVINWFGTHSNRGIDILAQMIHGTTIALLVGFVSMGIAAAIGIVLGACAGYLGGMIDIVISRLIEVMLSVPALVLILALLAVMERPTIWPTMAVLGATRWTGIARLMRAEFIKLRESDYVTAARSLGAGEARIMFRHILPNSLAPILVPIVFGIASAILIEAGLALLGFGTPPPNPSWGAVLYSAVNNHEMWWVIVFPGLAIFFTVLAYNLIGEGLQEATDPRLREGAK